MVQKRAREEGQSQAAAKPGTRSIPDDPKTRELWPLSTGVCKLPNMPWFAHMPKQEHPGLAKTLLESKSLWEELALQGRSKGLSAADRKARMEAAARLMKNHEAVLRDMTLESGVATACLVQAKQTQSHLERVPIGEAHHADELLRETARRLLCAEVPEKKASHRAREVWKVGAAYLRDRLQTEHMEEYKRAPDMSAAATAAMKQVLAAILAEVTAE